MKTLTPWTDLAGRVLLAAMFLVAGIGKIGGYDGTVQYMQAFGVPALLLPLVIFAEVAGGLALALGFLTRLAAAGLALFTLLAALIFHSNFAEQMQQILFLKNLAVAGGLLLVAGQGAGAFSLDRIFFANKE